MINIKKTNIKKIFTFGIVLLTFFRALINVRMTYYIHQLMMDDDGLMYLYADFLKRFNYLGPYNVRTLTKGISYSIFLAFSTKTWIPYSFLISALDILAAYVFIEAIKSKISNRYLLGIIYLLLLFNPMNLDCQIRQRMYRNSLVPDMVVLTFALLIGLFFRRNEELKTQIKWSVCAGISLSYFYYLREDSFWILPFVFTAMILEILNIFFFNKDKIENIRTKKYIVKRVAVYVLPLMMLFTCTLSLKSLNKVYYGVFLVNDRADSYFANVMEDLYKIDAKDENSKVWLSKDAVKVAFENSKSLKKIEKDFYKNFNYWKKNPSAYNGQEVYGDLLSWTFRGAAADYGIYKNAVKANNYWKEVDLELKEAAKSGKIKQKSAIYISKQARGIKPSEVPVFLKDAVRNVGASSRYKYCKMDAIANSLGNLSDIRRYETEYGVYAQLPMKTGDAKAATSMGVTDKANKIIKVYQIISKVVSPLALLSYIALTVLVVYQIFQKKFENLEMWLMITGVALSGYVLMLGVTFFTSFLDERLLLFYGSGTYSLMQMSKYMVLLCVGSICFKKYRNMKLINKGCE